MRRRSGLNIPQTLADACDPAAMALIVYDMQAGVLRQLPDGGAEAVQRVSRVLTAERAGGYPVFFTRHTAMRRVLDDFRFSGDTLLTDIATITPLLANPPEGATHR